MKESDELSGIEEAHNHKMQIELKLRVRISLKTKILGNNNYFQFKEPQSGREVKNKMTKNSPQLSKSPTRKKRKLIIIFTTL